MTVINNGPNRKQWKTNYFFKLYSFIGDVKHKSSKVVFVNVCFIYPSNVYQHSIFKHTITWYEHDKLNPNNRKIEDIRYGNVYINNMIQT